MSNYKEAVHPDVTSNYNIVSLHVDLIPLDFLILAKRYVSTYIYHKLHIKQLQYHGVLRILPVV
jgi:hypothetical protein